MIGPVSFRLCPDPGHGGPDPGNVHLGIKEAPYVFDLCARLTAQAMLIPEWDVSVLRDANEDPYIATRDQRARAFKVDFIPSVHADAGYDLNGKLRADWRGATIFYCEHNHRAKLIAEEIARAMPRELWSRQRAGMARVVGISVSDKSYPRTTTILYGFTGPTVLTEIGYLTNSDNSRYLSSRQAKARIVMALMAGCIKAAELYATAA